MKVLAFTALAVFIIFIGIGNMESPKVLFLGFDNEEDLTRAMMQFPFILFYTLVTRRDSVPAIWAEKIGSPLLFVKDMRELDYVPNYVAYCREKATPAEKRLLMKLKEKGLHGTIV